MAAGEAPDETVGQWLDDGSGGLGDDAGGGGGGEQRPMSKARCRRVSELYERIEAAFLRALLRWGCAEIVPVSDDGAQGSGFNPMFQRRPRPAGGGVELVTIAPGE